MRLNIRIVKKILFRGAAPLYVLEEKGWFGRWKGISYDRYSWLSGESFTGVRPEQIVQRADYEYVEKHADNIISEYKRKLAATIDKDLGFKPTKEVVGEYSTDRMWARTRSWSIGQGSTTLP